MSQINKPNTYFNTKLYTGNGSTQSITGVGFQPDWTWIKCRSAANGHTLWDSVRGVTNWLDSAFGYAEQTNANGLTSFDSDGFSVGTLGDVNASSALQVSWNWLAGGTASSNTDGSITSSVSVNITSGFSIVSYDSSRTPSASQTVGHGLGVTPDCIIIKNREETQNWFFWNKTMSANNHLWLNATDSLKTDAGSMDNTLPTSSVFSIGADGRTNSTTNGTGHIAYCFAEKKGFSKFGSYTGNGSTDGTFVYTGFKPAFVLVKNTSTAGTNWQIVDNKRVGYNGANHRLYPDDTSAESTTQTLDILSNGFKAITTNNLVNASGATYIYMAFAENPLVGTNNIPATAR